MIEIKVLKGLEYIKVLVKENMNSNKVVIVAKNKIFEKYFLVYDCNKVTNKIGMNYDVFKTRNETSLFDKFLKNIFLENENINKANVIDKIFEKYKNNVENKFFEKNLV